MPAINITPEEFGNVVIGFLLDKIQHQDDVIPTNEGFERIAVQLELKGIKPRLMREFVKMPSRDRIAYKRIKKTFSENVQDATAIIIKGGKKDKGAVKDPSIFTDIKDAVRDVVKLLKAHRVRTGFPVNEETLDKIINKVMNDRIDE